MDPGSGNKPTAAECEIILKRRYDCNPPGRPVSDDVPNFEPGVVRNYPTRPRNDRFEELEPNDDYIRKPSDPDPKSVEVDQQTKTVKDNYK